MARVKVLIMRLLVGFLVFVLLFCFGCKSDKEKLHGEWFWHNWLDTIPIGYLYTEINFSNDSLVIVDEYYQTYKDKYYIKNDFIFFKNYKFNFQILGDTAIHFDRFYFEKSNYFGERSEPKLKIDLPKIEFVKKEGKRLKKHHFGIPIFYGKKINDKSSLQVSGRLKSINSLMTELSWEKNTDEFIFAYFDKNSTMDSINNILYWSAYNYIDKVLFVSDQLDENKPFHSYTFSTNITYHDYSEHYQNMKRQEPPNARIEYFKPIIIQKNHRVISINKGNEIYFDSKSNQNKVIDFVTEQLNKTPKLNWIIVYHPKSTYEAYVNVISKLQYSYETFWAKKSIEIFKKKYKELNENELNELKSKYPLKRYDIIKNNYDKVLISNN